MTEKGRFWAKVRWKNVMREMYVKKGNEGILSNETEQMLAEGKRYFETLFERMPVNELQTMFTEHFHNYAGRTKFM